MRSLPGVLLWTLPLLVCTTTTAGAQTTLPGIEQETVDLTDLSLEELMTIDVEVTSVSRKSESLAQSAAAVYVITAEDIRRSGATSIPEALRMAPGLQVARLTSGSYAISARGFASEFSNKMLVLIDGRSVYTPLFSGVFWQNQDLAMEDIARIEVIRGPGAAMWGANAVNGVINIITKPASEVQGTEMSLIVGNEELYTWTVRGGGPMGDSGHLRAYAKILGRDGLDAPATGIGGDWQSRRGGFRADWSPNEGVEWTVQGDGYLSDERRSIEVASLASPPVIAKDLARRDLGGNLLSRWTHEASDGTQTSVQASYSRSEFTTSIVSEDRDTLDLDFQCHQWVGARHDLLWGLGYRYTLSKTGGTPTLSFQPSKRSYPLVSAFLQDEIDLHDRLKLILGAKLEHTDFSADTEFQPNVRVVWSPQQSQTFWGAVSRAVRTPSQIGRDIRFAQEVRQNTPPGFDTLFTAVGDNGFESEELLAYELGYRVRLSERTSVDVAAFLHDYDNLLTTELGAVSALGPGDLNQLLVFDNRMKGTTYGFEIATQHNVSRRWQLHLGYSLLAMDLDAEASSTDPDPEAAEDRVARHQAQLRSYYEINQQTELDAVLYYVDQLPAGIDSYLRADLRLGWRPNENTRISLALQGLFHDAEKEFSRGVFGDYYGAQTGAYLKVSFGF